jgi:squalene-hopene/tetraprenyl-beta-curcumene cyclase
MIKPRLMPALCWLIGVSWLVPVFAQTTREEADVRTAVERSLPFLEKEGVAWMTSKGCASCHHVPFLIWSHAEARAGGITIDDRKLADWTGWTWQFSRARREWFKLTKESLVAPAANGAVPADVRAKLTDLIDKPFATEDQFVVALRAVLTGEELTQHKAALVKHATRPLEPTNDGGGLDTLSQLLLGCARGADLAKMTESRAELRDLIIRWQQPDGSWKAAGQLPSQNRPPAESNEVSTRWAVLAVGSLEKPDAPTDQSIKRALDFLGKTKPGSSNESLVTAFLVERKFGTAERAADLLAQLRARQNPDGGWAWRGTGDSDAFATGQTLYALNQSGLRADDAAVRRAAGYLIKSQQADGSWSVPSRAISSATNQARLDKLAPIYRYWGTAWASIGLSGTLSPKPPQTPP